MRKPVTVYTIKQQVNTVESDSFEFVYCDRHPWVLNDGHIPTEMFDEMKRVPVKQFTVAKKISDRWDAQYSYVTKYYVIEPDLEIMLSAEYRSEIEELKEDNVSLHNKNCDLIFDKLDLEEELYESNKY